jgi:hypothetical protein
MLPSSDEEDEDGPELTLAAIVVLVERVGWSSSKEVVSGCERK